MRHPPDRLPKAFFKSVNSWSFDTTTQQNDSYSFH